MAHRFFSAQAGRATRRLGAAAIATLLVACHSSGVEVDEAKLAQFEKGKTTYQEVVQALGPPTQNSLAEDGTRRIFYSHVSTSSNAVSYVPIVGSVLGRTEVQSSNVAFKFDRNGVLQGYTASQHTTGY